jgi:DNA-binding LacI/PurR family transcriptional regulator
MSSLRKVAQACQVSTATVSYVINNGPRPVAPETRRRVLQTMRDMNYRPRALQVGERAKRVNTIGVLFTSYGPYTRPILDGIIPRAIELGQSILLLGQKDWTNVHQSLRHYCDGRCDGLLVLSLPVNNQIVPALKERGFPFVLLGRTGPDEDVSAVDMDNVEAAAKMTTYLLSQGHRRIAMLPTDGVLWPAEQRLKGYRQVLEKAGLYDDDLVRQGGSAYERTVSLIEQEVAKRPTAILCGSDLVALEAMQAVRDQGLSIPGDISVAGFDDIEGFDDIGDAVNADPPLTTVHQSLRLQGEVAIELLLENIGGLGEPGQVRTLPTELVIRSSVGPPPTSTS